MGRRGRILLAGTILHAIGCGETLRFEEGPRIEEDAGADVDAHVENPCVPIDTGTPLLAHSKAGFRGTQGSCGWLYRKVPFVISDGGAGVPAVASSTEMPRFANGRWYVDPTPGKNFAYIAETEQHPDHGVAITRRWVSSYAGEARIRVSMKLVPKAAGSSANGVTLFVFIRTREVGRVTIQPEEEKAFSFDETLSVDDTVDFVLSGGADLHYDTTTLVVEIAR